MIISITSLSKANGRPSSIGSNDISILNAETYTFTKKDFTDETTPVYSDPEGDEMSYVKILSLPSSGELTLDGNVVSIGTNIPSSDIILGKFKYVSDSSNSNSQNVFFSFDLADEGSQTVSGLPGGLFYINIAEAVNNPPDSVGDNTLFISYGEEVSITIDNFTTETTPPYNDPEGDSAYKIKILTLPSIGKLRYKGLDVQVNQEVLVSELGNSQITYVPDLAITAQTTVDFDFAISDVGSKQITE